MWIEKKKNTEGKIISYKFVERYTHPSTGKEHKVSLTHTKNTKTIRDEMLIKLHKKIELKLKEKVTDYDTATFAELIDRWLKYYKSTVKLSTYVGNFQKAGKIKALYGDFLIKKLTPELFNDYIEVLLTEENLKRNTVKLYKYTIEYVLKYGIEKGYPIDETILSKLVLPRINVTTKKVDNYLERNELNQLIAALQENGYEQYARLVIVQSNTGMRIGEILALNYREDIDFENNIIKIDKTFDLSNRIITPPKNKSSVRKIAFNETTKVALEEQIQYLRLVTLKHGYKRDNTMLFMSKRQNPVSYKHFNKMLKKINPIKDKSISSHTFRHTFITMMIEQDVPFHLIAKHVGHADTKMIESVYGHFTDKMDDELTQSISNLNLVDLPPIRPLRSEEG